MPKYPEILKFLIFLALLLPIRSHAKQITLSDDGLLFVGVTSEAKTVDDFLRDNNIEIAEKDYVFPENETPLSSGMNIIVWRNKQISLSDGANKKELESWGNTVQTAFLENEIHVDEDDIVEPTRSASIGNGHKIKITRVKIEEKIIEEPIAFETKTKEDDKLSWKIVKTEQKGEKGITEVKYRIVSHNGKEITRKILSKTKTKDPVTEIVVQGTYVKTSGKIHTGFATWYTQPKKMVYSYPQEKGMTAASPWLAIGSYARVTNKANGKQVIVRINDRGPFGKNRVLDLNTPAFQKIASLGAGVIDVKIEPIIN